MKKAFDGLKQELIRHGYESADADAQAAAYTRMLADNATLTDAEIAEAADQIDTM
jgi:hypothetical protein